MNNVLALLTFLKINECSLITACGSVSVSACANILHLHLFNCYVWYPQISGRDSYVFKSTELIWVPPNVLIFPFLPMKMYQIYKRRNTEREGK